MGVWVGGGRGGEGVQGLVCACTSSELDVPFKDTNSQYFLFCPFLMLFMFTVMHSKEVVCHTTACARPCGVPQCVLEKRPCNQRLSII